jgi:hypothetical protein
MHMGERDDGTVADRRDRVASAGILGVAGKHGPGGRVCGDLFGATACCSDPMLAAWEGAMNKIDWLGVWHGAKAEMLSWPVLVATLVTLFAFANMEQARGIFKEQPESCSDAQGARER